MVKYFPHQLVNKSLVNDAKWSGGAEFCPVGCAPKPLKIIAEKGVGGGARVHKRICNHSCCVANWIPNRVLKLKIIVYSRKNNCLPCNASKWANRFCCFELKIANAIWSLYRPLKFGIICRGVNCRPWAPRSASLRFRQSLHYCQGSSWYQGWVSKNSIRKYTVKNI